MSLSLLAQQPIQIDDGCARVRRLVEQPQAAAAHGEPLSIFYAPVLYGNSFLVMSSATGRVSGAGHNRYRPLATQSAACLAFRVKVDILALQSVSL